MRLDDLRPTENTDDRRGAFGGYGPHLAFGGGGLGLVGLLIVSALFGVNPMDLLGGGGGAPVTQGEQAGGPRADDAAYQFSRRIVGSAEDVWAPVLQAKGVRFTPATFTAYDQVTPTGCGTGQASAGPFYCPADAHIYLDLAFYNELGARFGAPGDFAKAYVVAHEYGHHIQNLLGTMDRTSQSSGAQGSSVRTELQADCYAGVWAYHANQQFKILESGDVEQGLAAASAVGDDTLEKRQQGYVVPDSFTHGTSAQRVRWFRRGLTSGDMDQCDTFSAGSL
ncbi:MAG: neutral zinc metallopeptidase [Alphaproteobacteria bacterium]|nr:neutral zinc metallopeptidase [Alphaproteobacteria bacterium]